MRIGKRLILGVGLVAALALATPSFAADNVVFSPSGAGGALNVGTFDWAPGNSLLQEELNGAGVPTGFVTVLFQANLAVLKNLGNQIVFTNGGVSGNQFITVVAGFREQIIDQTHVCIPAGPCTLIDKTISTFDFAAGSPNFFKIYVNSTAQGSDVLGTGFTAGTMILSGHAISDSFASSFTVDNKIPPAPLDNFGVDNYVGVNTVTGTGATQIKVVVDSHLSNYFQNLVDGTTLVFSNTSTIDPYNQTDPSAKFSSNGVANGDVNGVSSVGTCNGCAIAAGGTFNEMAQSDANSSFENTSNLPEPATLSLLGLGLLAAAGARRRQLKARK